MMLYHRFEARSSEQKEDGRAGKGRDLYLKICGNRYERQKEEGGSYQLEWTWNTSCAIGRANPWQRKGFHLYLEWPT